jgi:CheY-like chemotaxis protein
MTPRHLLIVEDDDEVSVFIARLILRAFPTYTSVRARDGAIALVAFALHPADLVITDMRMPGVSGLDLIRALRALPIRSSACWLSWRLRLPDMLREQFVQELRTLHRSGVEVMERYDG